MNKRPNTTETTARALAREIWADAGGNLDRALDLRDERSAQDFGHTGRTWTLAEDHIWRLAAHA